MKEKLKSIFREPRSALVLKILVFGGFLSLLKMGGFQALPVLFFLAAAFILSSRARSASFLVLLATAIATVWILDDSLFLFLAVILYSFIFYLAVGIKELLIVHRSEWNFIKNLVLFYVLALLFFVADKSSFFVFKYVLVFLAIFLLLREWLVFSDTTFHRRYFLTALVAASLLMQILWATALLPLGPINSANLMILVAYMILDFTHKHFRGNINRQLILKNITIFVLLLLVILATTSWNVG